MEFTLMVNHAVAHHIVIVCFLGIESLLEDHHASTTDNAHLPSFYPVTLQFTATHRMAPVSY